MWICLKFEMEGGKVGVHHPLQSRIGVQASLDLNRVRIYAVCPNEVGGFFIMVGYVRIGTGILLRCLKNC